jgi:hypothetical protein
VTARQRLRLSQVAVNLLLVQRLLPEVEVRESLLQTLLGEAVDHLCRHQARFPTCVPRSAQHSHRPGVVIDFDSCFEPLSLAVDAATMLEGFHSYAQELYLIGKEQDAGSNRQKVPFTLAKLFFDTGDRARLTVNIGTPP